jgi:hypothetical protein
MKGVRRFSIKGKLALHYIGSYPIIEKYGPLSYQVELPSKLSGVHNVFHISQLKRCMKPLTNVVIQDTIHLEPDLTHKAYPIKNYWNDTIGPLERRPPNSIKFNGMAIKKMKPPGNVKISYDPIFWSFFHQGKDVNLTPHYSSTQISR